MNYFERLNAIERLISELKAEKLISEHLNRDGMFIRPLVGVEPSEEDTPAIDRDATPSDGYTEKDDDHE